MWCLNRLVLFEATNALIEVNDAGAGGGMCSVGKSINTVVVLASSSR